jgi:ubiquinone/menaquinone biosynthesis C-methylase UbiE
MNRAYPTIFDRMSALADTTRARLLLVLERHELTVGEMCAVLQLPQSTVSRHLKVLQDEGWIAARAEGTSRRYRMAAEGLEPAARRLWQVVREQAAALPAAEDDARRLRTVLAERETKSQRFFSSAAGQWDRLRAELFGQRAEVVGLLGLVDDAWTVGDLGCGTGQVAAILAPFVRAVVAVDNSPAMLTAARERLKDLANVDVRAGDLEALPLDDGALDAAVLVLVLPYVEAPGDVLAEAARALRPGGRLLVVDMMPHGRDEFRQTLGHLWQGFGEEQARGWAADAGLEAVRYVPLPPDAAAKGPSLFAMVGRKGVLARPL